jgi:aminomethyltransferase
LTTPPGGTEALLPHLGSEGGVEVLLDSDAAIISVMGRKSGIVLQRFTDVDLPSMAADEAMEGFIGHARVRIVRSAFTGEDTYEIHMKKAHVTKIWDRITYGGGEVVAPIGTAAMNTLRIEACRPMLGFELALDVNPLEVGLDRYVELEREFVGSERIKAWRHIGAAKKLIAVMVDSPRIAWRGTPVFAGEHPVGTVTTGGPGLTLQRSLALALVDSKVANVDVGAEVQFSLGKQKVTGVIVKPPFYKKERR